LLHGRGGHRGPRPGREVLGSTLSGYTGGPLPEEPDLDLVASLRSVGGFVIAEGRYNAPAQAALARRLGADAVVVGTAITRPEVVTGWFRRAVEEAGS
jgi:putative N-acetylmannosamine-6-phosphate epimerase